MHGTLAAHRVVAACIVSTWGVGCQYDTEHRRSCCTVTCATVINSSFASAYHHTNVRSQHQVYISELVLARCTCCFITIITFYQSHHKFTERPNHAPKYFATTPGFCAEFRAEFRAGFSLALARIIFHRARISRRISRRILRRMLRRISVGSCPNLFPTRPDFAPNVF